MSLSVGQPGRPYPEVTAACLPSSLGRTHSFALVLFTRLPVSVYGTVSVLLALENFLGRMFHRLLRRYVGVVSYLWLAIKRSGRDLPRPTPSIKKHKSNNMPEYTPSVLPSKKSGGHGILTVCPSAAAFAIALGPTDPWLISIAKEPLDFRRSDFSSDLRLLVPTFLLLHAPPLLADAALPHGEHSPTTNRS